MYSKRIQIAKRFISAVLLLGIGWHTLSIHGLGESLIYCYESDGSVNIETKCDLPVSISSEHIIHADKIHHVHDGTEYHQDSDDHYDVEIAETCIKDNRTNRFDQDSALDFLAFKNKRIDAFLSKSALNQIHSFTPSNAEYQSALSLKTVVLRN
jgi:hypothetical protein